MALTNIRSRQRSALGAGRINARPKPAAFTNDRGEEAQLTRRAGALTLHSRLRQAGLRLDSVDERRPESLDVIRNTLEEFSTGLKVCLAIR
jgi:hypothetical protein